MSAPSGSGPTYLPIEYEYYYLEFVNWQNDNQGGGVSYNRTKNIINEPTFDDVNIIGDKTYLDQQHHGLYQMCVHRQLMQQFLHRS